MISRVESRNYSINGTICFYKILQFHNILCPIHNFLQGRLCLLLLLKLITDNQHHDGKHDVQVESAKPANEKLVDKELAYGKGEVACPESESEIFIAFI
jgi:hypothetical protein